MELILFQQKILQRHLAYLFHCKDVYKLKISTGTTLEEYHICNRWGHLLYVDKRGKVIKEGWDGKSNTGILFETNGVPDGTYFYSIKLSNEENRRVVFITVAR